MGNCSAASLRIPNEKRFRRAIKLYEVTEVSSMTNLLNRNKCFESGDSPLTLAAQEGHEEVVQTLLSNGADVNMLDRNGRGALHIAAYMNDVETLDILLDNRANPNKYDCHSDLTPLHIACQRGFDAIARKLLDAGADPCEDTKTYPPISHAARNKHGACVRLLLEYNADANVTDVWGFTPLRHAVLAGDLETVQALLARGADISGPSDEVRQALGRSNSRMEDESLIVLSAIVGEVSVMRALLTEGLDPNYHRADEPPALVAAVISGHADAIDLLYDNGADANVRDRRGQSALQIACWMTSDPDKSNFYLRYFSNVYRDFSRHDPETIQPEASCKCAMSLVQAGADLSPVWDRFSVLFPDTAGVTFEQMVLCEVLIQAFGFHGLSTVKLRSFITRVINAKQFGILKLLYSSGVNPRTDDLGSLALVQDDTARDMFNYVKKMLTSPRQLKDLCRQEIRKHLSYNVLYLIEQVDISASDKEYVCIMDTDYCSKVD